MIERAATIVAFGTIGIIFLLVLICGYLHQIRDRLDHIAERLPRDR